VVLGAQSRTTIRVPLRTLFAGSRHRRFGVVVAAEPGLQLVVERSTYSSTGGVFWAAGANAVGTRLR
jgi:hypothetical protein